MYHGKEPYIFVSYAHKDSDAVIPIVKELAKNNFRVWYDEGIEIASEWPEYIGRKIQESYIVIFFVSQDFVDSRNCRREVNFTAEENKEMFVVYLNNGVQLTPGLRLQLNTNQNLYRNNFSDENTFFERLTAFDILKKCLDVNLQKSSFGAGTPQIHEKTLGKTTFPGGKYLGELVNGIPNGKGKCTLSNGDIYKGDFVDGNYCGEGKYAFSNGDVFEGMFIAGEQDGEGKYTYKDDGRVLEGEFVNYKIVGKGRCIFSEGHIYEGGFRDNKLEGKGKLTFSDGAVYEGEFANDEIHGKGKLTYANSDVYEGCFSDSKRDGEGNLHITESGEIVVGTWKDNYIFNGYTYDKKGRKTAQFVNGQEKKISWVRSIIR